MNHAPLILSLLLLAVPAAGPAAEPKRAAQGDRTWAWVNADRTYRTIASRDGRALCGWSMGGGGALRCALKYPERFCAAASFSAAIGDNEIDQFPKLADPIGLR
jgi:pimeloyl-ACP methyl ester carboxylesterase